MIAGGQLMDGPWTYKAQARANTDGSVMVSSLLEKQGHLSNPYDSHIYSGPSRLLTVFLSCGDVAIVERIRRIPFVDRVDMAVKHVGKLADRECRRRNRIEAIVGHIKGVN